MSLNILNHLVIPSGFFNCLIRSRPASLRGDVVNAGCPPKHCFYYVAILRRENYSEVKTEINLLASAIASSCTTVLSQ